MGPRHVELSKLCQLRHAAESLIGDVLFRQPQEFERFDFLQMSQTRIGH